MAKIDWKYPIEAIHGALKKGVFGAAKHKSANAKGEVYNYSVNYGKRTTDPSQDEIDHRTKFGAIAAMVGARRNDITKRSQDQAAFKAQSTYTTLRSYLWSICAAQWEAAQDEN